ncbi:MAG: Rieske 2Fe-2S domain-containing protein [Thaumarchaeota archaeon]|nr:Rieske 2Fe-2S domain-containing protein [Candidatus Calditenuaceae archaeon]MDW8187309.1 Rieske 2Fe-2S domain-containing protein [Nitrososphaerota archaeon]
MPDSGSSRRRALKAMLTVAVLAVIAPFTNLVRFFYREDTGSAPRQRIANTSELKPGSSLFFSYPRTGDPKIDGDPFRQWILIMTRDGKLRAYSRVCVHLWCLPIYVPERGELICPCHGSIYKEEDGVAIAGPAAFQPYPTNALPMMSIEVDEKGDIYATGVVDGRVGLGREWKLRSPDTNLKRV